MSLVTGQRLQPRLVMTTEVVNMVEAIEVNSGADNIAIFQPESISEMARQWGWVGAEG
jgi:cadmium resistance protein CadD (predicted permease)